VYSPSKSVAYLDEYVRFMQTNNKSPAQNKRHEQLDSAESDGLQEATAGQNEAFKMGIVAKHYAVTRGTSALRTWSSLSSAQKSAVAAQNSIVGLKHEECEQVVKIKIGSRETEAGGIATGRNEAEVKIKTETVSFPVTNTVASLKTTPTFVSGVGCEKLNRMQISVTGLASASGLSEVESHKRVINAVGGLLEMKKQGVGTSAGIKDTDSHCLQETMAALHKCREVSVTPVSSLGKPKLDTGQSSTQLSDSEMSNSPAVPATSTNSTMPGRTCGMFKAEIPCMSSKVEKLKSEPKPQTEFRIQIIRKNEVYLCNTETGEIKPLHTAKPSKKSCRSNSGATHVLDRPSSAPANSKSTSLGPPAIPTRVSGPEQNTVAQTTNTDAKSEQSKQVSKTAHVYASSHNPVPRSSQLVSKPDSGTFPDKPVISSISKESHSEVKPSQINKPSMFNTPPHVSKIVISRKPTATPPSSSKGHSTAPVTADQKRNRRKPKYIIHNAHGKMSRHTTELQEALDSCVESMLATDRDDNSVTLFGPRNTSDAVVRGDKTLPSLIEGTSPTSDENSSKDVPGTHWPSLGREVIVETTTDATPPLLEVSPPLLEPASSHQLTSSGEEGSSQPPQLTPESNTSIRTASTPHVTAKNRKCKFS
jgi:hypothetical protein